MGTSRREFLTYVSALAGAGTALSALAACKSSSSSSSALSCEDTSALSDADKMMRTTLKYLDKAADPSKVCNACNFFVPAASGCGTCQLVKGPINPAGGCTSWVQKKA